jgi:hypothetical protein
MYGTDHPSEVLLKSHQHFYLLEMDTIVLFIALVAILRSEASDMQN